MVTLYADVGRMRLCWSVRLFFLPGEVIMLFSPVPFGKIILDPNILKEDRKKCIKAGPCGMGERALYLNSFYLSRRYYVVYSEIRRVFKRIAMSSGGFTGKGAFSTIPYLVVVLKDGSEKQCNFKVEENVDVILKWIAKNHPEISTVTEKAERAAALQKGQAKADVPKEIQHEIDRIRSDEAYLEKKPEIYQRLSAAVRRKRTIDQMPKSSVILVSAIALAGFIGLASGIYFLTSGEPYGPYLLLFGAAFLFFSLAAGTLPVGRNTKAAVEKEWRTAVAESERYISGKAGFFLPPQYAHPVVCERMIRVLESGRAKTCREALDTVKRDLKSLNSGVKVSQEEHDEVVQVKPLFLECNYQDKI